MRRIEDGEVRKLFARRLNGETFEQLAADRGCTPATIRFLFRTRGFQDVEFERACALEGCDIVFTTNKPLRGYCSRKHAKLGSSRTVTGRTITVQTCALPECSKEIQVAHKLGEKPSLEGRFDGRRFCSREHSELHRRRVKSGWYERLLGVSAIACEVCGHEYAVDEHHEVFDPKTGSDLSGPTHWLCATHHQMIHRGFAEYVGGIFVERVDQLRQAVAEKQALFGNYLGHGESWADK